MTSQIHDQLRAALGRFSPTALARTELKPAAVAVTVIIDADRRACVLLTRRTPTLRAHAGQLALPGGRIDRGETAETAARRELAEELGIHVGESGIIGKLDDYPTRSGYLITPVVIWAGEQDEIRPQPSEVAEVYWIPLDDLGVEPQFLDIAESPFPVIRLPLAGRYVHAPTAAVLHQFGEVVLHGRDTRVSHLEQPLFAWR